MMVKNNVVNNRAVGLTILLLSALQQPAVDVMFIPAVSRVDFQLF
jgi:hypothetical protein